MSRRSDDSMTQDSQPRRKSGRAVFDESGHTSWEWQTSTGVFERHISEEQLNRIAVPDLQLVEHSQPRPYEGLWIHDSHRPARVPTGNTNRGTAPAASRESHVVRSGFLHLFRKLAPSA